MLGVPLYQNEFSKRVFPNKVIFTRAEYFWIKGRVRWKLYFKWNSIPVRMVILTKNTICALELLVKEIPNQRIRTSKF